MRNFPSISGKWRALFMKMPTIPNQKSLSGEMQLPSGHFLICLFVTGILLAVKCFILKSIPKWCDFAITRAISQVIIWLYFYFYLHGRHAYDTTISLKFHARLSCVQISIWRHKILIFLDICYWFARHIAPWRRIISLRLIRKHDVIRVAKFRQLEYFATTAIFHCWLH